MVEVSRLREETFNDVDNYFNIHTDDGDLRIGIAEHEDRIYMYEDGKDVPVAIFEYESGEMIKPHPLNQE
jgi:hypothetical protein